MFEGGDEGSKSSQHGDQRTADSPCDLTHLSRSLDLRLDRDEFLDRRLGLGHFLFQTIEAVAHVRLGGQNIAKELQDLVLLVQHSLACTIQERELGLQCSDPRLKIVAAHVITQHYKRKREVGVT